MKRTTGRIIRPDSLDWPSNIDILQIGLSQSLWSALLSCRRRFLFIINGYSNPRKVFSTNFGSMVHEVNDKVYSRNEFPTKTQIVNYIDAFIDAELKKNTLMSEQLLETEAAKAEATLVPYFEYYKKDFHTKNFFDVEKVFSVLHNDLRMRGKIDGKFRISKTEKWLLEHKTKGQINEQTLLEYLPLDFQNLYYLLADELETKTKAKGVLYNVIRNTGIKQKKNQSIKSYSEDIRKSIAENPEHHFKRWEIVYPEKDQDEFKVHVNMMAEELKDRDNMLMYPNRWSCQNPWPCPFLTACSTNSCSSLTKSNDTVENILFPELANTSTEKTSDDKKSTKIEITRKNKEKLAKRIKSR
ncbi:MAG: PD-(D/E)XK nuclease family protein [Scytonema sp. CRU_2_7]|nr:PD-(D/E)XK nuclease family protein [Scytonema sp. CRU_2_7]